MLSAVIIYLLFLWGCIEGLFRPWVGLVVFFAFVTLEPDWNWRWAIDTTFPFQKYLAASIITGALFSGLRRQRVSGATFYALASLIAFLALAYLSTAMSINREYSLAYMGVIWKIVLMAVLTVWLIDTPQKLWMLMWAVVICQGYNAYQINLQYFQDGFSRYTVNGWGNKGDNNVYSIFTVPIMAISAGLAVYGRTIWQMILAGGIFVMQLHVLMLLESRGTMIGGLVLAGLFAVLVPKTQQVWGMIGTAVLCGVLLSGPSVVDEFVSAFERGENRDSSADSRFEVWKAGATITLENPLFGVGPNAGRFLVPMYVKSEKRDQKALHNLLFEIGTGCGIPATLFYLAFFGLVYCACTRTLWLEQHNLPDWAAVAFIAVACGVPGYWAASMFSSGALLESSYLLVSIGGAALLVHQRIKALELKNDEKVIGKSDNYPWESETLSRANVA